VQRDLAALSNQSFDLLVIGGGIQGACVAWDATLRGLSVALVEQADFASSTSANSLKVVHGGLRYLQTADFARMRQSILARQAMLKIAPHLVHPLPVLVPTYGHSTKGKEAMAVALKLNDLISCDRNLPLSDSRQHIPAGQMLSKQECLAYLPDLPTAGLTGAARFHDAQMYNSEQLVLAFLQSAAQRGAQVANYVRVTGFVKEGDRVIAATATDALTENTFTIRAQYTINASGPGINSLIGSATDHAAKPQPFAKAMNLVTRRLFDPQHNCAVGITSREPGSRLFFIAPWRTGTAESRSLIGTWYGPNTGTLPVASEVEGFLADVNRAYPSFNLTLDDVDWIHTGLLPSDGFSAKSQEVKLTKHFQLRDHRADGLRGLLSVIAVKYTTAGDVARRAVDWVFRDRGAFIPPSTAHKEPLYGGDITSFDQTLATAISSHPQIPVHRLRQLVCNYGSAYPEVLKYAVPGKSDGLSASQSVLAAEVKYAIATTLPQTLDDIIFRRTELGAAGHPGDEAISLCCQIMGDALQWTAAKRQAEIDAVQNHFARQSLKKPKAQQPSAQPNFQTDSQRDLQGSVIAEQAASPPAKRYRSAPPAPV
jgi:glycerol-3-phosphate dehydrogenase